jgi:hypothetical protein
MTELASKSPGIGLKSDILVAQRAVNLDSYNHNAHSSEQVRSFSNAPGPIPGPSRMCAGTQSRSRRPSAESL